MKTKASRRGFLKATGSSIAIVALESVISKSFADPLGIPIGLQLYTLYGELQKDFEGVLQKVAAIGIRDVELISFPGRKPTDVLRALRNAGLRPIAIHVRGESLVSDAQKQIDDAGELSVKYLVCPGPVAPDTSRLKPAVSLAKGEGMTLDDWRWNADLFNKLGEQTQKAGIQFGYHNHSLEFERFDGVTAYDELLKRTDPKLVTMEMDCGWVENSREDAAQYLQKYPGRFQLLHIKDIKRRASLGAEFQISSTEVGSGLIDWKRIFSAAKQAGVRSYFIEQEPPFERPVLESVRMSYEWLHAMEC